MTDHALTVRPVTRDDAGAIALIYNHYVVATVVTFEQEPVSADAMAQRVADVTGFGHPWLVAERDGRVVGYAYAGPWKLRFAYRFSAETTIYLDPDATGAGVGTRLYEALFAELRALGKRGVMAGIALPNPASVALHERFGMRRVATFSEVGFKHDRWIDVGYWQVLL